MCPQTSCSPDTATPGQEAARKRFGWCASLPRRAIKADAAPAKETNGRCPFPGRYARVMADPLPLPRKEMAQVRLPHGSFRLVLGFVLAATGLIASALPAAAAT